MAYNKAKSEAETETETETNTEKETSEETSASERTEVSEDELYRMTLPDPGETVTLKKRTVWSQDQKLDVKDYHPESATLAGADVVWLKGEIDYSGEDISEVTYQATLQEDSAYQWYVVVPFAVTDVSKLVDATENKVLKKLLQNLTLTVEMQEKINKPRKHRELEEIQFEDYIGTKM